jgi:hypothetical protein
MSNVLIDRLKRLHARLEHTLRDERSRPLPNSAVLAEIKKAKLRVRDRLAAIDTPVSAALQS